MANNIQEDRNGTTNLLWRENMEHQGACLLELLCLLPVMVSWQDMHIPYWTNIIWASMIGHNSRRKEPLTKPNPCTFSRKTIYQKNSPSWFTKRFRIFKLLYNARGGMICNPTPEKYATVKKGSTEWAIQAALSAVPPNKCIIMVYYGSICISGQLRRRLCSLAEKGWCRCCG